MHRRFEAPFPLASPTRPRHCGARMLPPLECPEPTLFSSILGDPSPLRCSPLLNCLEATRARLRGFRMALYSTVDVRCDELVTSIDSADVSKTTALERALIAIYSALKHWRAETGAVRAAASSLSAWTTWRRS